MYKKRIHKWHLKKNLTSREKDCIIAQLSCDGAVSDPQLRIGNTPVKMHRIRRHQRQRMKSIACQKGICPPPVRPSPSNLATLEETITKSPPSAKDNTEPRDYFSLTEGKTLCLSPATREHEHLLSLLVSFSHVRSQNEGHLKLWTLNCPSTFPVLRYCRSAMDYLHDNEHELARSEFAKAAENFSSSVFEQHWTMPMMLCGVLGDSKWYQHLDYRECLVTFLRKMTRYHCSADHPAVTALKLMSQISIAEEVTRIAVAQLASRDPYWEAIIRFATMRYQAENKRVMSEDYLRGRLLAIFKVESSSSKDRLCLHASLASDSVSVAA